MSAAPDTTTRAALVNEAVTAARAVWADPAVAVRLLLDLGDIDEITDLLADAALPASAQRRLATYRDACEALFAHCRADDDDSGERAIDERSTVLTAALRRAFSQRNQERR